MSSLTSSYAGALILASMAALGAAYLGNSVPGDSKAPTISPLVTPPTPEPAPAPAPTPTPEPAPAPSAPVSLPSLPDIPPSTPALGDRPSLTEEEARRKLKCVVSNDAIDAMFKFVKTPVKDWSQIGPTTARLSKLVGMTMTHPDRCPAVMARICALVFNKYSQMVKAIRDQPYDEVGSVWTDFAELVDELPDCADTTSSAEVLGPSSGPPVEAPAPAGPLALPAPPAAATEPAAPTEPPAEPGAPAAPLALPAPPAAPTEPGAPTEPPAAATEPAAAPTEPPAAPTEPGAPTEPAAAPAAPTEPAAAPAAPTEPAAAPAAPTEPVVSPEVAPVGELIGSTEPPSGPLPGQVEEPATPPNPALDMLFPFRRLQRPPPAVDPDLIQQAEKAFDPSIYKDVGGPQPATPTGFDPSIYKDVGVPPATPSAKPTPGTGGVDPMQFAQQASTYLEGLKTGGMSDGELRKVQDDLVKQYERELRKAAARGLLSGTMANAFIGETRKKICGGRRKTVRQGRM